MSALINLFCVNGINKQSLMKTKIVISGWPGPSQWPRGRTYQGNRARCDPTARHLLKSVLMMSRQRMHLTMLASSTKPLRRASLHRLRAHCNVARPPLRRARSHLAIAVGSGGACREIASSSTSGGNARAAALTSRTSRAERDQGAEAACPTAARRRVCVSGVGAASSIRPYRAWHWRLAWLR